MNEEPGRMDDWLSYHGILFKHQANAPFPCLFLPLMLSDHLPRVVVTFAGTAEAWVSVQAGLLLQASPVMAHCTSPPSSPPSRRRRAA